MSPSPTVTSAAPVLLATSTVPAVPGAPVAVEVAALLGDDVIHVKHCTHPRGGHVTRATVGLLAASALGLVTAAVAFHGSVTQASANAAAYKRHTEVLHRPSYAFRPVPVSPALGVLAFGGLALGLAGATLGLARARRERTSPFYRVGTAAGVEQPLITAPGAAFPLVAPAGDAFVFNAGPGIDAEMLVGGAVVPLAELVRQGRAWPSASTPGAIEVPLTLVTRIRARSGHTTFMVSAVEPPRAHAVAGFTVERRTLAYAAGSLALHLGVWAFLQTVPVEDSGANIDMLSLEDTTIRAATTATEDLPPAPVQPEDVGDVGGSEDLGAAMRLEEGASGNPNAANAVGQLRIKNNQAEPSMAREQAIEEARTAGILGSSTLLRGGISALAANSDFSSGFDDANVYGAMFGAEGEGRGMFGGGRSGFGMGGGCTQEPCGTIGVGRYGTIPRGGNSTDGWGGPNTGIGGPRKRVAAVPVPRVGPPIINGDLDRAIIRRYIQRNLAKISYCYEKQLLAKPGIGGTVGIVFLITPSGSVKSAAGTGFDGDVASCVAGVIQDISFPAPNNGGAVQVNYPFTFHAAGQ